MPRQTGQVATAVPWLAVVVAGVVAGVAVTGPVPARAAPLDALLSAWPERGAARGRLEAGVSAVNRRIDFSDPDDDPALAAQAADGDYRDAQLSAAWAPAEAWWLSAGVARHELDDGSDRYRYWGWQLAGQWRLRTPVAPRPDAGPALALRLAAWGHRAAQTRTTTPVRVPGAVLDSVTVQRPADRTLQFDGVATWSLSPALQAGVFAGLGETRLSYGGLQATTTRNGCRYDLQFSGNDILGTLAEPCDAPGGVVEQFFDSSGAYGVDVAREIAWRGRFVQFGVNVQGQTGPWAWAAGLLWHRVQRDGVDDILAGRGRPVVERNRMLVLDGEYRVQPRLGLFVRLQLGQRLFFNELPVTYNSSTSGRFGSRLSLVTAGLRASF